ncbi:MAG: PH domain-containing protein [Prevotellaceae bacterium]|nr:PH domain-containing protein [Prevotellaceae bacterium]
MNRFIRKSLEPGEQIVYSGRLHWSYVFSYNAWGVILALAAVALALYNLLRDESIGWLYYIALGLLVVAIVLWLIGCTVRTRSEFVVTATRFIQKDGIFSISMTEIPLFKVETVNYHQTFFQRIIGTGCIELVGSGGTSHSIHCIESPMEVRQAIVAAINKTGNKEEGKQELKPQSETATPQASSTSPAPAEPDKQ